MKQQNYTNYNEIVEKKEKKSISGNREESLKEKSIFKLKAEKEKKKKVFLRRKIKKQVEKYEENDDNSYSISRISEKNSTHSTSTQCRELQKKNTRNHLKYEKKNLMLGTNEEYEKFFKNDRNSYEYSEIEKNLIEKINNEKLRSKIPINLLQNEELRAYLPQFEIDLENVKPEKNHLFMMNNFAEMYDINNFYLFTKKNLERKKDLIANELVANIEKINTKERENINVSFKSNWKRDIIETNCVEEYLFEVEKIWPNDEYNFSQELSLELLMLNDYNITNSINKIKTKDVLFKNLVKKF